jgi:hypothetical protein
MKRIVLFLIASLAVQLSFAQKDLNPGTFCFITIENPDNFARKNCPVVIQVNDITAKFKKYNNQRIGLFEGNTEIQTQFDDLNKDGKADEVAFLIDLPAKGKVKLYARMLPPNFEIKNYKKELFAELIKKEKVDSTYKLTMVQEASSDKDDMYNKVHHHGVAFESEQIAYRLYFDKKQTVDVYAKVTPRLEIPVTQWYPTEKQMASGWGADIVKVGSSVGVGTFKGWDGNEAQHFDQVSKRTQRIVVAGNVRNVVEIEVEGWQYAGKSIHAKIRYIQYARHRDAQCQVLFDPDFKDSLTFCTGVFKPNDEKYYTDKSNLVGSWDWTFPEPDDTIKYKRQTIGCGVYVPVKYAKSLAEDKRNHLILLSNNGTPYLTFYLTAAGLLEKKGYKTPDEFFKYQEEWKKEMASEVSVTISEK